MAHIYTPEEEKWLLDNVADHKYDELTVLFNEHFGLNQTKRMISLKLFGLGYRRFKTVRFTKEEDEWLRENYPSLGRKETTILFNKKFNKNKNKDDIHAHCTGVLGIKVTEETHRKNLVKYHTGRKKLGSEHYDKDKNIMFVKAYEDRKRRNFIPRAQYVYMKHNGLKEIPKGYSIIHLDGDTMNDDIENLAMIDSSVQQTLCRNGWTSTGSKEFTKTAIKWCELNQILKKGEKENG